MFFFAGEMHSLHAIPSNNSFWHQVSIPPFIQIGIQEVKLSLFADDMILYIENPKDATRKLPELINEFGRVAGYKFNAQKSLASLYTNDEISEREIKEKNLIYPCNKKNKILRNIPTKGGKRPVCRNL